ncbi:hypothetical protein [Pseudonocardia alni]|uniref:hypothetical protein n=1 Tax=Pseudonocardia alni TaxID=33907 RepID=UPI001AD795D9|nr:hypothetical protein [Pseudonocardia alni]MBO4239484.1 hypothetical protein [Pseudonocardia alni]
MTTPVPPVDTGFDAIVAQLLAADPDVLYRRADAVDAVVVELETARDGLRRETRRVQEAMLGATADGFAAESAAKVAALERSLEAVRTWPLALRGAGDELARARSAAMSLREQRAAWAGHPQAAEVEETFAAAARAELARVETAFASSGGAQQPIAAVPGSSPTGGPTVSAVSTTAPPQPEVVTAVHPVAAGPTAGIPGLTTPGPEAAGIRAAALPAAPGPVTDGSPTAPVDTASAPTAFALGGQTLGAPAAVPSGTLQSAPVTPAPMTAARTTAVAPSGVLGRPSDSSRTGTPATVTAPAGALSPESPGADPDRSVDDGGALPGGLVGMAAGGVLGRGTTGGRTPAGTGPSPATERTDATRREAGRTTGPDAVGSVSLPEVEALQATTSGGGPATPSDRVRAGSGPLPSSVGLPPSPSVSSGGPAVRVPTLPVTGDAAAIATLPVTTPTPDPRSAGRLPLSPAAGEAGMPGGAPMGGPFMPMGAGMAAGMNQNDDRTRETSLTADPSNWQDDGVPGVLGRS